MADEYREMTEEITADMLGTGEYTDGRIIFKCPQGFEIEKSEID